MPAYNHTRVDSPRTPCELCAVEVLEQLGAARAENARLQQRQQDLLAEIEAERDQAGLRVRDEQRMLVAMAEARDSVVAERDWLRVQLRTLGTTLRGIAMAIAEDTKTST